MSPAAAVLDTARLRLRRLGLDDAAFILRLVNDPDWLRYIGDKQVRSLEAARGYIVNGPQVSYARFGFGLWLVERNDDATPIGLCGLIKRDALDDVDLGFAFLPAFRGQGYAFEAAAAVVRHARATLALPRLAAITAPDNDASIRLLEKLGLRFERMIRIDADGSDTRLFGCELRAPSPA